MAVEQFGDVFSDYISTEGDYVFVIKNAELMKSRSGLDMVKIDCNSDQGSSTLYFTLNNDISRNIYKKFVAQCFGYATNSELKAANFSKDIDMVHLELEGKNFIGKVVKETYIKEVDRPRADGLGNEKVEEERTSYKIKSTSVA